jgi:hypothetical protein
MTTTGYVVTNKKSGTEVNEVFETQLFKNTPLPCRTVGAHVKVEARTGG